MVTTAHAGLHSRTQHSRANCVNNESITWHAGYSYNLYTISQHYHNGFLDHTVTAGWEWTWRSAAVHWNEAWPGNSWQVIGYHWINERGRNRLLETTNVNDCSIYDGWWD